MGFHDKTRLKSENKKWSWLYHWTELMFPFHFVKKLNFYHNLIQSYAYLNFRYNQSSFNVIMEIKPFKG